MLFLAEYYVRWVATSHDETRDRLHRVIIEEISWEQAYNTIVETEQKEHQYCKVKFKSLSLMEGTVLWK